jgi:hypothetical protein
MAEQGAAEAAGAPARAAVPGAAPRRGPGVFAWFVVLLLLAEAAAWWRLPYRHLPSAAEVPRNVRSHRGFPEYLMVPSRGGLASSRSGFDPARDGPESDGGERPFAVVIGNSQAVGMEVSDPERIWCAELRRRLAGGDRPAHLENWSLGGLRTAEVELLALAALERGADLLVFVLHFRNFDPVGRVSLDVASSDVPLLAGHPALWPAMDGLLLDRDLELDEKLVHAVMLGSSFARMRNPILDRLSHVVPPPVHRFVFGHLRDPGDVFGPTRQHSTEGLPTPERRARWVALGGLDEALEELGRLDEAERAARLACFDAISASVGQRAAERGARVVWVWAPADVTAVPADVEAPIREFLAQAGAMLAGRDGDPVDLLDAVPHAEFVSLSHFGVEGHARMAALMEPVVRDALP